MLFAVPPIDLQTVGVGSTWIEFTWEQLSTSHNVSNYVITVNGAGSREVNVTVESSASRANVTELEPTTEYTLTVIALTVDGQMSHPSIPLTILTGIDNYTAYTGKLTPFFFFFLILQLQVLLKVLQ